MSKFSIAAIVFATLLSGSGEPRLPNNTGGGSARGLAANVGDTATPKPLPAAEIAARLGLAHRVLTSAWNAGFPRTVTWDPRNVVDNGAGGVALLLSKSPERGQRPYRGGEFQTQDFATVWGRVEWQARLPAGISGSVAAMFLFKDPFSAKTDREFDLEYVPGDPKVHHAHGTMQMTLHMKRHTGSGDREAASYRIKVPARCIEGFCGWAIEFQPKSVVFQIRLDPRGGWETVGRFTHHAGWDPAAGWAYDGAVNGKALNFSTDEIWSEQPVKAFTSYWCTNDLAGWLGALDESELTIGATQFQLKWMVLRAFDTLPPFAPNDWTVGAKGALTVASVPFYGLHPTGVEYRVDGGDWVGLDASADGAYALPQEALPGQSVEIRSVARGPAFADSGYEIVSAPSDRKIVP